MSEIKSTSFRINEDDNDKFKQFASEQGFSSQAEAFQSIMQTVEMARAKGQIKDRAKEIEVFQDTVNSLIGMFINSLAVNQTSEERIREELSKELLAKENTISTLNEQIRELKVDKSNSDNNLKDINNKNKELQEQLQKVNEDIIDKNKSIDKLNSNNDLLQENLQEYKQYKENYKVLEKDLDQLSADNITLTTEKTTLENTVARLQGEIDNKDSMNTFYKEQLDLNKDNINILNKSILDKDNVYKADIKALDKQHKQEIHEVKEEHTKALDKEFKSMQEQLNSKYDVELSKKDLEIQKLKNDIEKLNSQGV